MLAVLMSGSQKAPRIGIGEICDPQDEPGRLLISVASAGITRGEPRWITNWWNDDGTPREQPITLGLEFAGHVRCVGRGVRGFAEGQGVMGMLETHRGGAMAELASADARDVLAIPAGVSCEEASTLPVSGMTAWQAMIRHGKLSRGQRVLIHGGAGAVGTFAIQIGRWIGAHVVVTASAQDEPLCRSLGADDFIDHRHQRFEDWGNNYDLVFDQIGGEVQERSWALLKRGGRLVTIAGEKADAPDQKRAQAAEVVAIFFIVDRNMDDLRQLTGLVRAGSVRTTIGERYLIHDVPKAFADGAEKHAGKAVLLLRHAS